MTDFAYFPSGLRHVRVFELNENGRPNAVSAVVSYTGYEFVGPKAFTYNAAAARTVPHAGKDRVLANDTLPAIESSSAEIRVSAPDIELDAILSGVKKFEVGPFTAFPRKTDKQGSEPQVGVILFQQGLKMPLRTRIWHSHIIPVTRCVPVESGMSETTEDHRYTLTPSPTARHMWGVLLTELAEGALEMEIFDGYTIGKPFFDNYLGDGVQATFPLTHVARDAAKVYVAVNGVVATPDSVTTTEIDFGDYPPTGDVNIVYDTLESVED